MLPAYLANMAPIFFRKLDFLNYPLDFNIRLRGKPLLGKNKTFRGLLFGTLLAIITAYLQSVLVRLPAWARLSLLDYSNWLWIGFLLGFGALFGDAAESFVKRRLGIKPGGRFLPWDQLDFVFGALLFVSIVFLPPFRVVLTLIVVTFFLHIATVRSAYYLRIRKEKW